MGAGASPLAPTASRSSTSSGTFDAVAPLASANAGTNPNVQPSQRLSPDSNAITRLPSITADGLLIEAGLRDRSPTSLQRPHDSLGGYGQERVGTLPTSPTSHTSQGGAFSQRLPGNLDTDSPTRDFADTAPLPIFSRLVPVEATATWY